MPLTDEQKTQLAARAKQQAHQEFLLRSPAPDLPTSLQPTTPESQMAAVSEAGSSLAGMAKRGALPTMLGAGMGAVGTAMAGPVGGLLGQSLGSGGGEYLNQQLGVTAPDETAILLEAGVPLALHGGYQVVRGLVTTSRGGAIARNLEAVDQARAIPAQIQGRVRINPITQQPYTSEELYKRVKEFEKAGILAGYSEYRLGTKHVLRAAEEIKATQMDPKLTATVDDKVLKLANEIIDQAKLGTIDMKTWDARRRRFGEKMKFVGGEGASTTEARAYAKLHAAVYHDMDETVDLASKSAMKNGWHPEALEEFKDAIAMHRIEKTQEEIKEAIEKRFIKLQEGSGLPKVNKDGLRSWLVKDASGWIDTLPPSDKKAILEAADAIMAVPKLPPPSGPFDLTPATGVLGAAGGYAAHTMGADPVTTAMMAAMVGSVPKILASSLATAPGRALIKTLMSHSGGVVTPHALGILGAYAAAAYEAPNSEMLQPAAPPSGGAPQ